MNGLTEYATQFVARRERPTPVEWAENNLELSPRITESPGPYSTRFHPYVREVLNSIADTSVKRISLCWGSQTAKTTTFYVSLGWVIAQDSPKAILWVFPNLALCKAFSAERWMPFCMESGGLVDELPRDMSGKFDTDRFNLTKQEFRRATMNLVGAGSAANVRSYPVSVLVLDEIDVISPATRREALDRVKARHDYKILQSSTPIEQNGGIWEEFMAGDRRRFYLKCPHCKEQITLRMFNDEGGLNIRWNEKAKRKDGEIDLSVVQKTACYICESCEKEIRDHDKIKMLSKGKWIPTSSSHEIGFRSYHLNSLYSPQLTFGRVAVEYLKSSNDPGALKTFVNGWLAEPFKQQESKINPDEFKAIERDYERGEMKGQYRIIGVDVQRAVFYWVIRGFDADGTSYLVDHGTAPTFDDLEALAENYGCSYGCVDTGFRAQELYEECFNRRPFWFAVKGWDRLQTSYRMNQIDPFSPVQGQTGKATINLLHVNKSVWQAELLKKRNGESMNWFCYRDVDPEYIRQMLSTNLVERVDRRGKTQLEWHVEGHRQDHFWDCENYILALSHVFGLGGSVMREQKKKPAKKAARKMPKKKRGSKFWG